MKKWILTLCLILAVTGCQPTSVVASNPNLVYGELAGMVEGGSYRVYKFDFIDQVCYTIASGISCVSK